MITIKFIICIFCGVPTYSQHKTGHAYTALLADAVKRWVAIKGQPVHLMTGTDEHGVKVQDAAQRADLEPQAFCDGISGTFRQCFDSLDISYDSYMRTTSPEHKATVARMWTTLLNKGFIYKGEHRGWYSRVDEAFVPPSRLFEVPDSHPAGTPPAVAEGDRSAVPAHDSGLPLTPEALGERKAVVVTEAGHRVEYVVEENYKFRLSAFRVPLLEWLQANPAVIQPPHRCVD
jgi:methionyl-tRNA synthetase